MAPVLDLACGRGRNALFLARLGFKVHAIDISHNALVDLLRTARREQLPVLAIEADLESFPLPEGYYGGMIVFRFLQRPLFDAIRKSLRPGGLIVYETFLKEQSAFGAPRDPAHLLARGELRELFQDFEILFYDEGLLQETPPAYLARLVARKPASKVHTSTPGTRSGTAIGGGGS